MASRNYQDLVVWQKAMDLVESVYRFTQRFPKQEQYGLSLQMRRAVVSVPSNIAEGQGRGTTGEFGNHLRIAHGSLRELETQTIIAGRLSYLVREETEALLNEEAEVGRLLNGLRNSVARGTR